jgi:hypothetical protein
MAWRFDVTATCGNGTVAFGGSVSCDGAVLLRVLMSSNGTATQSPAIRRDAMALHSLVTKSRGMVEHGTAVIVASGDGIVKYSGVQQRHGELTCRAAIAMA